MAVNLKFKDETMTGSVLRPWTVPMVHKMGTGMEINEISFPKLIAACGRMR